MWNTQIFSVNMYFIFQQTIEKHKVEDIFYFVRCVGKWCNLDGPFQCLSIRQVTEDERKVYRLRINASERAMRAWKLKNSEF